MSSWVRHVDPDSGLPYYHNTDTEEVTWEAPAGFDEDAADTSKLVWLELKDPETGVPYYFCEDTQETRWQPPDNAIVRHEDSVISGADDDEQSPSEESDTDDERPSAAARPAMSVTMMGLADEEEEDEEEEEKKAEESRDNGSTDAGNKDSSSSSAAASGGTHAKGAAWEALVDPNSGVTYYHNKLTDETCWEPPNLVEKNAGGDDADDDEEEQKRMQMRRRGRRGRPVRTQTSTSLLSTGTSSKRCFIIPRPNDVFNILHNTDASKVLFVDVRTSEEYNGGHIPGSINVPIQDGQELTNSSLTAACGSHYGSMMQFLGSLADPKNDFKIIIYGSHDRSHLRTMKPTPAPVVLAQYVAEQVSNKHDRERLNILEGGYMNWLKGFSFCVCQEQGDHTCTPVESYPIELMDNKLFIGTAKHAADLEKLKQLRITHIVNCTTDVPQYHEDLGCFEYSRIPIEDSMEHQIIPQSHQIHVALYLILNGPETNRLLVHCVDGLRVSSAIVMSYLIQEKKISMLDAYNMMKKRCGYVETNAEFLLQLQELEMQAIGQTSLTELLKSPQVARGVHKALTNRRASMGAVGAASPKATHKARAATSDDVTLNSPSSQSSAGSESKGSDAATPAADDAPKPSTGRRTRMGRAQTESNLVLPSDLGVDTSAPHSPKLSARERARLPRHDSIAEADDVACAADQAHSDEDEQPEPGATASADPAGAAAKTDVVSEESKSGAAVKGSSSLGNGAVLVSNGVGGGPASTS